MQSQTRTAIKRPLRAALIIPLERVEKAVALPRYRFKRRVTAGQSRQDFKLKSRGSHRLYFTPLHTPVAAP